MNKRGFTLIELVIVMVIIGLISAIAIPALLRARMSSNEGSTLGTLRTLATSQAQIQANKVIDQDGDGTGEYGLLGELTGVINIPGTDRTVNPAYLTRSLAPVGTDTYASKSGYYFRVYLPVSTGNPLTEVAPGSSRSISADNANFQEIKWRGYAWPASSNSTGDKAFAVDRAAEVYAFANTEPLFTSTSSMCAYNSATVNGSTTTDNATFAANIPNGDARWKPSN